MYKIVISLVFTLMSANALASLIFITPTDVTSSTTPRINDGNALIKDALDIGYVAPNPSSGGNGTSTWHNIAFNSWTFNFDNAYTIGSSYIWDYYTHSPTDWNIDFFSDINGSGMSLGSVNFSLGALASSGSSKLHTVSFSDMINVKSITLSNKNQSIRGGVGLAEVQFGGSNLAGAIAVSEPTTLAILALGLMGLTLRRFKKKV